MLNAIPGWTWKAIDYIKPGDILSHWGSEDIVKSIARDNRFWTITVYDGLLHKELVHQYALSDELLVKD